MDCVGGHNGFDRTRPQILGSRRCPLLEACRRASRAVSEFRGFSRWTCPSFRGRFTATRRVRARTGARQTVNLYEVFIKSLMNAAFVGSGKKRSDENVVTAHETRTISVKRCARCTESLANNTTDVSIVCGNFDD